MLLNEKHYQLFKKMRYQKWFPRYFGRKPLTQNQFELLLHQYKSDFTEELTLDSLKLEEVYPEAFGIIDSLFGYSLEEAKLFVIRFNYEFIKEFDGLTIDDINKNMEKYLEI